MNFLLRTFKNYSNGFLRLIYPNNCVVCSRELAYQEEHLCFLCKEDLHYTYFEKYKDATASEELFYGKLSLEIAYSLLYFEEENSTQRLLHEIKYRENQNLGKLLGSLLGKRLILFPKFSEIEALIPIPLHSKKEFIRGYNQSLLIARGVEQETHLPIIEALYRTRHDESQTKKSKEERYENVKGKFALKEGTLSNQSHVLIVDDVLTTGATLEFAAKAILERYPKMKISIATVAIAHH